MIAANRGHLIATFTNGGTWIKQAIFYVMNHREHLKKGTWKSLFSENKKDIFTLHHISNFDFQ